jgi:hypothetical protein
MLKNLTNTSSQRTNTIIEHSHIFEYQKNPFPNNDFAPDLIKNMIKFSSIFCKRGVEKIRKK